MSARRHLALIGMLALLGQRPGEPSPAAPHMLFAPCPLAPQNLPNHERRET